MRTPQPSWEEGLRAPPITAGSSPRAPAAAAADVPPPDPSPPPAAGALPAPTAYLSHYAPSLYGPSASTPPAVTYSALRSASLPPARIYARSAERAEMQPRSPAPPSAVLSALLSQLAARSHPPAADPDAPAATSAGNPPRPQRGSPTPPGHPPALPARHR